MVRLTTAVHHVTGLDTRWIFWNMPIKLAFAYEHQYWAEKGYYCELVQSQEFDLVKEFLTS